MKTYFLPVLFVMSFFMFAQEESDSLTGFTKENLDSLNVTYIEKGIITIRGGEKINFTKLYYEEDKIQYFNPVSEQNEFLYIHSILTITDSVSGEEFHLAEEEARKEEEIIVKKESDELQKKDKTTVYFVRPRSLGGLINFTFFDGEKVIGQINGGKYLVYECEVGEHIFWARSENKSFVKANLEKDKIYIIESIPTMGAVKAAVRLQPIDKKKHNLEKIQKLLSKKDPVTFTEEEIIELQNKMKDVIDRGMETYKNLVNKKENIKELSADMTVEKEDLILKKKK